MHESPPMAGAGSITLKYPSAVLEFDEVSSANIVILYWPYAVVFMNVPSNIWVSPFSVRITISELLPHEIFA